MLTLILVVRATDKEPERPDSAGSEQSIQSKSSTTRSGSRTRRKRAQRRKKDQKDAGAPVKQTKSLKDTATAVKTR